MGGGLLADDPYSRASVSYRGDDPVKTARLREALRNCVGTGSQSLRLQLLLDANGRVVGRPTFIGPGGEGAREDVILRVQRCGPITAAATPGSPCSYQIEL